MDRKLQETGLELRAMESGQAASWLIKSYPLNNPGYGDAFQLLKARSWKRNDQLRLARYYLQKAPFASEKPYEIFISFMSIKLFILVPREFPPKSKADADLLIYHLRPVLQKVAKTAEQREIVNALFYEFQS